jgi:hypothetical protein
VGCVHGYQTELGFRAREAVKKGDIDAFDKLMAEAAQTLPHGPFDNPKRTVLTHFMDFGGSERFFPMIESWKEKGWVADTMTCLIHRARYKGVVAKDPAEADRAADVCLEEARRAAESADLRWAIEACLDEAPFLTLSSTSGLARYLAAAVDPSEPYLFREGLLHGMTALFLQDPATRRANDPKLASEPAWRQSRTQLDEARKRFDAILAIARATTDVTLLAGATMFGAMEIERVSLQHGSSYVAEIAARPSADDADLAWGWVRSAKSKERVRRFDSLGIYDRKREPLADAYWFYCTSDPNSAQRTADAVSVLSLSRVADVDDLRRRVCADKATGEIPPNIFGPFPLEVSARGAAQRALTTRAGGDPVRLIVKSRATYTSSAATAAVL